MQVRVFTHRDRPEFGNRLSELEGDSFPPYLLHDGFDECRPHLFDEFADLQLYVVAAEDDTLLGTGNALPYCVEAGRPLPAFQELLTGAPRQHAQGIAPNMLCPIQAMVVGDARGTGVSGEIMAAYNEIAAKHGFKTIGVPVRPTLKPRYPITPIDRYVAWTRADGSRFDPWLRQQERMGSRFVEIHHASTVIEGSISDWQGWTGMEFPESGEYVIPDGHVPLVVDRDQNLGRYAEPHVWYVREVG